MAARSEFDRNGYLGPVPLLTREECRGIASYLKRSDLPEPPVWEKGRATHERTLYDLATRPSILERVTETIGTEVVLWGITAVSRAPGQVHPWHSDIESCGPEGGFVSVWLGIENTSRESSLQLISGSHLLGASVQEARASAGIARDDATPEALLELARNTSPEAAFVAPDMQDGEAIFFDGRLWHGTANGRRKGDRLALLVQFAAADREIRIPDWDELDWPFRIRSEPLPPVIVVSGSATNGANHMVQPPAGWSEHLGTAVHTFDLALDERPTEPWRPHPALHGHTSVVDEISSHASVLDGGHSPHPLHAHVEEELVIPLHGPVELVIGSGEDDPAPRAERLEPGSFVYYPAWQWHTIRNTGTSPVAYLMLKWRSPTRAGEAALGTEIVRFDELTPATADAFSTQLVLEGATGCLAKLHSHVTVLQPGAGYEPHRDAHDVAIVLLEGEIETLGRRVHPTSVVYCSGGELHGMRNPGTTPARYLVFELHAAPGPGGGGRTIRARVADGLRRARARRP